MCVCSDWVDHGLCVCSDWVDHGLCVHSDWVDHALCVCSGCVDHGLCVHSDWVDHALCVSSYVRLHSKAVGGWIMDQTGLLQESQVVGVRKWMGMKSWPLYCCSPDLSWLASGSSMSPGFLFSPSVAYRIYNTQCQDHVNTSIYNTQWHDHVNTSIYNTKWHDHVNTSIYNMSNVMTMSNSSIYNMGMFHYDV